MGMLLFVSVFLSLLNISTFLSLHQAALNQPASLCRSIPHQISLQSFIPFHSIYTTRLHHIQPLSMNAPGDGCEPNELISEAEVLLTKQKKFWESLAKAEWERAASNDVGISTPTLEKETSNVDDNTANYLPSVAHIVYTLTLEEKMEHGWTLEGGRMENWLNLQLT